MPKLFISIPMNGYSPEDIRSEMNWMKEIFDSEIDGEFELIDTIFTDIPPKEVVRDSAWYLGKSIQAMSEADIVLFHPEWRNARGCLIEHFICALYEIPYIELARGPEKVEIHDSDDTVIDDSQEKLRLV